MIDENKKESPWFWIPTLYFAEGIPYALVMLISVIMYKRLEISNADIALYTSWLYLPWVIKPFWSPFVDIFKTKRWWIIVMQLLVGAGLAGVALTLPVSGFFKYSLAFFWLIAFSSATHDIAADGFYMIALPEKDQSFFVGIRSTFYRLAMIFCQGGLVFLAGQLETNLEDIKLAWIITFSISAVIFLMLYFYHNLVLPKTVSDRNVSSANIIKDYFSTFVKFFEKKNIMISILFLLIYRFGEGQLAKLAAPFLLDTKEAGGLALSTSEVGVIYGTIGVAALTAGGILGGIAASKNGLKYWFWWMIIAINIPDVVYIYLSAFQPDSFTLVSICIAVEQFGYGFGFTAYMLFMIFISEGEHKTSHFALATGFMALGMMLPGMISGWIQESIGYQNFFIWVTIATIPAFIIAKFVNIDPEFGKKNNV